MPSNEKSMLIDAAAMLDLSVRVAESTALNFLELWHQSWKEKDNPSDMQALSLTDASQLSTCLRFRSHYALIESIESRFTIPDGLMLVLDGNGNIVFRYTAANL